MRVVLVAVYSIMLFLLCACRRYMTIDEMRQETRQKLMGRWQLEKKSVEIFDPYPILKLDSGYVGVTEDFFHFKEIDSLIIGEAGQPVTGYKIYINVTQVVMPRQYHNNWFIDSLNNNRLVLSWEGRHDDSTHKLISKILYFTR